ncbi:MAG: 2,3-bisphosphoglycerate-independent phosphoglycerate mutase [Candidatus Dormibacteria bacterium]
MRKLLFVVLSGMADRPIPELGDRTLLEAARTPLLDALARRGQQGQLWPLAPDIAPESDAAAMSLLGYEVEEYYTGRGPLEVAGAGLEMRDGDLAWKANFATADSGWNVVDRRVGRSLGDGDARELAAAVQKDVHLPGASIQFVQSDGFRGCLLIRSTEGALSGDVSNVDPAYHRQGRLSFAVDGPAATATRAQAYGSDPAALRAAELSNAFLEQAFAILDAHPVNVRRRDLGFLPGNFILLRDAGDRLPRLPSFAATQGPRLGAVVDSPVQRALAELAGMQVMKLGRATGHPERDFNELALRTDEVLAALDGAYVHIKTPDIPAHDGDADLKVKAIEDIERFYFGRLGELTDLDALLICVTSDHATPVSLGRHSNDPVPILLSGGVEPDGAGAFGESSGATGAFGYMMGTELMPRLAALARA